MNEGMMEAPRGVCTEPPATCPSPGLEVLRGACVGGSPVGVPVSHRVRVHGMAEPQPWLGRGGGAGGALSTLEGAASVLEQLSSPAAGCRGRVIWPLLTWLGSLCPEAALSRL